MAEKVHSLDPESTMAVLKDNVITAVGSYFPFQGRTRVLEAEKIYALDSDIDVDDVESQKNAKFRGRTWSQPIYGDFVLRDKVSGDVVAKASKVPVANLPHITRRYSYIVDGSEYQADSQWRLMSGAYSRVKANGELETQFNLSKGRGFRVQFDPEKKDVTLQYGAAFIPAYPVLHALGVSDDELKKSWGPELVASVSERTRKGALLRLAKILDKRTTATTDEQAIPVIAQQMEQSKLNPEIMGITLGKEFDRVTPEAIVLATNKLIKINKGEAQPDERDSILFKELWNISDHMPERILNSKMALTAKLRNNVDRKENIREIVTSDLFNIPIKTFFTSSSLAQQTSQTNPVDMLGNHLRTTLMGTGGIGSENAISLEAKQTHPSQLGVVDPVHTPEGSRSGISTHLSLGVSKRGKDPVIRVYDLRNKEWVDRSPREMRKSLIAFPDQYDMVGDKPVLRPGQKTIVAVSPGGGDPQRVDPDKADYVLRSPKAMFSYSANLVPFLASVQANRAEMATRHIEQTVPLRDRQEPLVQSATGSDKAGLTSWEKIIGKQHSHRAPVDGTVTSVTPNAIMIKDSRGESFAISLYDNFPLNEKKAFVHSQPTVKPGDRVTAGDTIADTNFTKNGVLALGTNLRLAYLAYRGGTFEDGVIISESAANKLTSEHLSKERLFADTDTIFDARKFRSNFPSTITDENAKKLDDSGVIKKGSVVKPGDTLIAAMKKSDPSPEQLMLKGVHRALAKPFKDMSVSWDRDVSGIVTDISRNGRETVVYVKTEEPASVADKLCYTPDHDVLTANGWKNITDILMTDKIASLNRSTGFIEYVPVGALHNYDCDDELIYSLDTTQVSMAVTLNHGLWVSGMKDLRFSEKPARSVLGKPYRLKNCGRWIGTDVESVRFDEQTVVAGQGGAGTRGMPAFDMPIDAYLMLLGAYLSEGSLVWHQPSGSYGIDISQSKEDNVEQLVSTLTELGFNFSRTGDKFRIYGKQLAAHFAQFGYSGDKFIPAWVLDLPTKRLNILYKWLVWGDGHAGATCNVYCTTSPQLADDFQQLLLHIGMAGRVAVRPASEGEIKGVKYTFKECYYIHVYKNKNYPSVNHGHVATQDGQTELLVHYTGKVYCVTLEANHVLYVRRKGKAHWSCNSGRFGNKGVISMVLPDSEMPLDKDGNPIEIIVNPSGVPGRINPAQVLETSVSNAAAKAGVVVEANSFEEDPDKRLALSPTAGPIDVAGHYRTIHTKDGVKRVWVKPHERDREKGFYGSVNSFLSQTGTSETTELIDPTTKKSLGEVLVGYQYIHKHMHQVDKKLNVRAHGHGFAYDANLVPRGSGNHDGAQRYGELGLYAMLAHGATANIREGLTWKSNRDQDEVWTAIQTGQPLPMPKSSFAYSKFLAYLNAVGLNIEREGDNLRVLPLTDKQTLEMSSGALTDASRVIRGKDMAVEKGGLFDPKITGGIGGKKWSHISLGEGIPNPIFEPAITSILGLTGKDYDAILAGNKDLDGKTGPAAVVEAISKIDVGKELAIAEETVKTARKDSLNRANSRVKYLRMLKTNNMKASDAYVMNNLAVLPPVFRPVSAMESGDLNIDGLNLLYREVAMISQQLARSKDVLPEKEVAKLRGDLYNATSALVGMTGEDGQLSDGVTRPPGVLGVISGKIPKESFFHKRLMDRKQDVTARSVIVPDMTLTLDQISIPRKAGLTLYRPFVVKELVSMGYTPLSARAEIDKGTPLAKRALEVAATKRPVLFKRDPVLHKYGIQAFKPVFRDGAAIGIHPLAVGGFNADFDGDQMALFVPISQDAVDEAYKMMPSRNVFSPSTGKVMYTPTLEGQLGLYLISMFGKDSGRTAATLEDAAKLGDSGMVSYTDAITVGGKKTTAGRAKVYLALPESARADEMLHDPKYLINKSKLSAMLTAVGKKENGDTFAQTADKLKNIGFGYAHSSGFSFSLSDFDALSGIRDKHMKAAEVIASEIRANKTLLPKDRDAKVIEVYLAATKKVDAEAKEALAARGSKLLTMNAAGVKPDWGQLKQLVVSPGLVENASGRTVPVPISRSYSEGVTAADYITASEGARKGLIEKVQSVQEPGALTKQIINTAIPYVVAKQDCHTTNGISLDASDPEIVDRYLAKPVTLGSRVLAANTLITPTIASELKAGTTGKVVVRSPLKCTAAKGLCAHCYGAMDDGHPPKIGTNIGVIAGQAIGERGTQLAMKCNRHDTLVSYHVPTSGIPRITTLEALFEKFCDEPFTGGVQSVAPEALTVYDAHNGWVPALNIQRHEKDPETEMLFVKTQLGGCTVTQSNHPVWVLRRPGCKCHTPILRQREYTNSAMGFRCNTCKRDSYYTGKSVLDKMVRVPASDLAQIRGSYYGLTDIRFALDVPCTDATPRLSGYLVGAYASDGCCRIGNGTEYYKGKPVAMLIACGTGPTSKRANFAAALTANGLEFGETDSGLEVYSPRIAAEMRGIVPGKAINKRLSENFLEFGAEWLADFLCGYIDGDGTVVDRPDGTALKIYTSSYAMLQTLLIIANKLGIRATPGACTYVPETMNAQPWQVTLFVTAKVEHVFARCDKWNTSPRILTTNNAFLPALGLSEVTLVKEVPNEGLVYDIKTATGGFNAGTMRTSNSFHFGGVVGSGNATLNALDRVTQLLQMPETLPGKAAISSADGKVTKIEKSQLGGFHVFVGDKDHYVAGGREVLVKVGDDISRGKSLSSGPVSPRDLLEVTDLDRVQRYMSDELFDAYKGEGVKRQNAEVVIRAITDLGVVDDPGEIGSTHGSVRGDMMSLAFANDLNKQGKGTPIEIKPILRGVGTLPLDRSTDFLARMQYRRLKDTMVNAANRGWESDIHDLHPIPGIVYSAEFGRKDKTRDGGPY